MIDHYSKACAGRVLLERLSQRRAITRGIEARVEGFGEYLVVTNRCDGGWLVDQPNLDRIRANCVRVDVGEGASPNKRIQTVNDVGQGIDASGVFQFDQAVHIGVDRFQCLQQLAALALKFCCAVSTTAVGCGSGAARAAAAAGGEVDAQEVVQHIVAGNLEATANLGRCSRAWILRRVCAIGCWLHAVDTKGVLDHTNLTSNSVAATEAICGAEELAIRVRQ